MADETLKVLEIALEGTDWALLRASEASRPLIPATSFLTSDVVPGSRLGRRGDRLLERRRSF